MLAGCERNEEITSYSVPKESDRVTAADSGDVAGQAAAAGQPQLPPGHPAIGPTPPNAPATPPATPMAEAGDPHWTLPPKWKPLPLGMVDFARFATSDAAGALPVTVTEARGSMLNNVNRWEGQFGLPRTPEAELGKVLRETKINGVQAFDVDLKSADGREMLVVVIPQGDQAWFFKLNGPADQVAALKAEFNAFTRSVSFGEPKGAAPGPVPGPVAPATAAADSTPFTFTVPTGWKPLPATAPGPMNIRRAAAFSTSTDAGTAEVTVIPLPPEFGDLTANLNRWRGQVGLPPGGEGYEPPKIMIDGREALLIDLTGPAPAEGKAKRMIMAVRTDAHSSWFFKILGPADVVSSQQAAFREFLSSIKFKPAAP